MHFLKLFLEAWLAFGVITLIVGLIWTSSLSSPEVLAQAAPKRQAEFDRVALAKVRSA